MKTQSPFFKLASLTLTITLLLTPFMTTNVSAVPAWAELNAQKAAPAPLLEEKAAPGGEGINSIVGSTVTRNDAYCYLPGGTRTFCFIASNNSPDAEWLEQVALTFPAGWTAACNSQDASDSGGNAVSFACSAATNSVSYDDSDSDGGGEILDGETWRFCVDANAPGGSSGTQAVEWALSGDGWGAPPHDITGTLNIDACTEMGRLEGLVYDYDGLNPVAAPASVHLEPGNIDVPVISSSGYYSIVLDPGIYTAVARADNYPEMDGPHTLAIGDGLVTQQDFILNRPDIEVNPTSLSASAIATSTVSDYFTITNNSAYTLDLEIREVPPVVEIIAPTMSADQELARERGGIQVEAQLQNQINADGAVGYMIYFRQRPDLSPAFDMDWIQRGRFVVRALQAAAERSQANVRAYLDAQGADYTAFWIDNVIVVNSSNRSAFDGLLAYPEIESLRARRVMGLIEPIKRSPSSSTAPMLIEDNISHVQADDVWNMGYRGEGMVVANIDSGVRYTHETLEPHYRGNLGGSSFDHDYNWLGAVSGDTVPTDDHGHGSHTMGTMIGDDDGTNQIGMAPGAQWIACDGCSISGGCPDVALLTCAQWVAAPYPIGSPGLPNSDMRPHVVNNSWGGCLQSYDDWYQDSVDAWHAAGIYPVFSNGNASNCSYSYPPGLNTVGNPARYGNVTGVGSTGQSDGQYATHSNWGPSDNADTVNPKSGHEYLKPQVVAPGVNIRSSLNGSDTDYDSWDGTSMSAPHVAGLIALIWQAAPCLVGDYANTETIIEETATAVPYDDGTGSGVTVPNQATGWGEINALAAVQEAQSYCGTDWLDWVTFDPITGTLRSDSLVAQVNFTCNYTASQQLQPLQGQLLVKHNDPTQDDVAVDLEFICVGSTISPMWDKAVWINDQEPDTLAGPHVVRPGDALVVVDRVGAAFSQTITSALTDTWGDALELMSYDAGGVGDVISGANQLVWNLNSVAPNVLYPITKTFTVRDGDWINDTLIESYHVEGAAAQRDDVVVALQRRLPAITLYKSGPASANYGDVVSLTLVISSSGSFSGHVALTDALPAGMTYAGNLTYTHGRAWEDSGVVYWTSYTETTPPPISPPVNVVTDGSFEAATPNPNWNEASTNFSTPICDALSCGGTGGGTGPHTGDWWTWFGGTTDSETSSVDQDVTILAGDATLSFWLEIPVTNIPGTMEVMIDNTPIFSVTEADAGDYGVYSLVSLDVDAYADGGVHNLRFEENNGAGADVINFFVDDVALEVAAAPMPALITVTFDAQVSSMGQICNLAQLDWGDDYTDDQHCVTVIGPGTEWINKVYVNDVLTGTLSPTVFPGDTVQIVDQVRISYTSPITFQLAEEWTEALELTDVISTSGAVSAGATWADWDVDGAAPNTWHVLTKTYNISESGWSSGHGYLTATLSVEGGGQFGPIMLDFWNGDVCVDVSIDDLSSDSPVDVGQTMHFTATVSGSAPLTYTWDFGAGTQGGTDANPTFIYNAPGAYTVTLEVQNGCPSSDSLSIPVTVNPLATCLEVTGVSLTHANSGTIHLNTLVHFSADIMPNYASMPYNYHVDYGDGVSVTNASSADPLLLDHAFDVPGAHNVEILVWNCSMTVPASATLPITISGQYKIYLPLLMRDS